jgi:hypothetical protein
VNAIRKADNQYAYRKSLEDETNQILWLLVKSNGGNLRLPSRHPQWRRVVRPLTCLCGQELPD